MNEYVKNETNEYKVSGREINRILEGYYEDDEDFENEINENSNDYENECTFMQFVKNLLKKIIKKG